MNGSQVIEISLDKILPNRFQPRIKFHEKNINELAESIREHGVIQPIVVRKISDKYEIIAGERRYKASVIANKKSIPALIVNLNDKDAAEVALIENVQRQDLTPIEEAVSYKKILDMGMTQEQLAQKLGKTQSTVANKLRLLNLDEQVQEALLDQKISERHARSLLKLSNLPDQVEILNRIISERLTVRKTDQVIKDYLANKTKENTKNNVEVLNIEEKGENNMNNNDFNIPTSPIEGDNNQSNLNNQFNAVNPQMGTNDVPSMQPIPDFSVPVQENVNNPGFMDVNKIENQAQDIYTEPVPANVDNLLSEDQKMVEINNQIAEQNNESSESESGGKFFNFMPNNNQENFVSDLEKQETNMNFMPQEENVQPEYNFDSYFNNNYVETNNNPVQSTQTVETPAPGLNNTINDGLQNNSLNNGFVNNNVTELQPEMQNTVPESSQPMIDGINNNVSVNSFGSQSIAPEGVGESPNINISQPEVQTITPEVSQPAVENASVNDNFINNNMSSQPSGFTFEEPVLQPVQSVEPSINVETPAATDLNNNVASNNFGTNDDSIPQFIVDPNDSFNVDNNDVNNVQTTEAPSMTTPQDLGFNMDFRNINPDENVNNSSINSPVQATIPTSEMPNNQNPMNVNQDTFIVPNQVVNNNMVNMEQPINPTVQGPTLDYNEAINTLKNCCNELQNKGFNVSLEQFDLENMAQIVVKIQK